jgi:hypothetical protein
MLILEFPAPCVRAERHFPMQTIKFLIKGGYNSGVCFFINITLIG